MQALNLAKTVFMKRFLFFLFFLFMAAVLYSCIVYAEGDSDVQFLKQLKEYEIDSISSFLNDGLRTVGFGIVKFLGGVADDLYAGVKSIYNLLSFGSSEQIKTLMNRYSVLYKIIFVVSVTFFGIYLLCGKNTNQLNTVNCIFLIVLVVTAMPLFTEKMTKLTVKSAGYVQSQWVKTADKTKINSIASSVLAANVVDLKKIDRNSSSGNLPKGLIKDRGYNYLEVGTPDWKYLNINTVIDYEDDDQLKLEHWNQKITQEKAGKYEKEDMEGTFIDEYYYRYQIVSWFDVFVLLGTVVFLLFFICIKCGKIVVEVAMANIYMPFVAITDLTTGQRIREALKNFLVLFAVLFLCIALLGIYFAGFSFINENAEGFTKLVMHIALVWAVLEGPNVIERIAGVDAGLKGFGQKLMGIRAAAGMAGGAAKLGSAMGKGAGKIANAAAGMAIGKAPLEAAKDKVKDVAGAAVQKATDGKGLLGAGQNLAGAGKNLNEKMRSAAGAGGVESPLAAEKGRKEPFVEPSAESSGTANPFEKDNSSVNRSSPQDKTKNAQSRGPQRADRSAENLAHLNRQESSKQVRPAAMTSSHSQADRSNVRGMRQPNMAGKAMQVEKPSRTIQRPQVHTVNSRGAGPSIGEDRFRR